MPLRKIPNPLLERKITTFANTTHMRKYSAESDNHIKVSKLSTTLNTQQHSSLGLLLHVGKFPDHRPLRRHLMVVDEAPVNS